MIASNFLSRFLALSFTVGLRRPERFEPLSDSPMFLLAPNNLSFDVAPAPIPQAGGSKIVFASSRDGFMQIYVMNSDGTGQTRLTTDGSNNENPRWSPDGTKILFQSDRDNAGSGLRDIYVMNSNGSGQTRLTTDGNDDCFASWSADGTKIVFQSFRNGVSFQIYTMNADGSGPVNVSNNGVTDTQPSWSPDGTKIAFASDRDQPGFPSVYVMNANGASQTRLTFSGTGLRDEQPAWSPNGSKIAFASTRDSVAESWTETDDYEIPEDDGQTFPKSRLNINKEVYVMNPDGSGQARLTNDLSNDDSPMWSPDGAKIVFRSERERDVFDATPQIWTMNPDGSGQTNLSNSGDSDFNPSWASGSANQSPVANAGGPYSTVVGQNASFSGSGSYDPDGTIASYAWNFGDGTTGTGVTATHAYTSSGTYTVTLTVTDNSGSTGSATASVTITANAPPTVSFTSPANGASFTAPANVTLTATASDTDGTISKVQFFEGTTLLNEDLTAPYSFNWNNVAAGSYSLTAKAFDNLGGTTTSAAVAITVNALPSVSLTAPTNGQVFTAPANITLTATASDTDGTISKVQFFQGTTLLNEDLTVPYSFNWNNVAAGTYSLAAKATDNAGSTTTSGAVSVTVSVNGAPAVSITSPAFDASFTEPASITIAANATDSDGTVSKVDFYQGTTLLGTDAISPYSFNWNNVAAGTYTLTVTATDNGGATGSATRSVTVTPGNQSPVSVPGGPYSGVVAQNAPFSGSGSYDPDGTIVSYSWTFGDGGTGSGVAPYHAYGTIGTFNVTLTVTDNLGAQASASTTINISASSSDQYATSFLQWALGRPPTGEESAYWTDIFRAAYPKGLSSMKLATRELGMTVFESAEYTARNRNDHWYVYDLYKTFLMREPDVEGWAHWEAAIPIYGRDQIRRGFDESTEFANIVATLTASGSPSANVSSLATARVDSFNQSGNQLQARDAEWSANLLSLPGRAGLDLGLNISYSSLVFTRSGPYSYFDADNGSPSPGFHIGFPTIQDRYFDAQVGANVYLLKTGAGRRIELRQVGTSNVYESADSSYLQLVYSGNLLLRTTDGTQMTFGWTGLNEYRCTSILDRNGNYMVVNYDWRGDIQNVTDTLGRVITFNYDASANLNSITQSWNGQTHTWATFGWENLTMQPTVTGIVGTYSGEVLPVLKMVAFHDSTYTKFIYNGNGQVERITQYASDSNPNTDNHPRNYTDFDYDSSTTDCPRLISSRTWAEYWTGFNGVPTEVATQLSVEGDKHVVTSPDGTVYKETYAGSGDAPWMRGLVKSSEVWSGSTQQKLSTVIWTQDNTSAVYKMNPRVIETNVYDSAGNRRRVVVDYSVAAYAQYGLPYFVAEYGDQGATEIRRTYTDYKLDQVYLDRRIIGLVTAVRLTDANGYQAKVTYGYDNPARLDGQATTVTMHDQSYHGSFTDRGNVTSVSRWDVTDLNTIVDPSKALTTFMNYNAAGSVISTTDSAGHTNSISYSDSFSDGNNSRNTLAYPATLTDADGFSSVVQYNFDFGAKTRVQTPLPNVTTNQPGPVQTFEYDDIGRLQRVTSLANDAYTRYVYGPYWVQNFSTVNTITDEAYSITTFDGVGRAFTTTTNHPGSDGGYKLVNAIFDRMGRPFLQSNPTEVNSSWLPVGDDTVGVRYSVFEFDWQGRTTRTTHPDGYYKQASYSGCGCAGGQVVTLTDEVGRRQKAYADVLGRNWKTEVLNWDGSVYSTATNTFNARDQITLARQFAGTDQSQTYQDTTISYDGYGRLQSKHVPAQNTGTATTWEYNNDDTLHKVTDARGASATYVYNNNRHLVNGINYFAPSGIATTPNVTFEYDAAGNRTLMNDGLGNQSYVYNSLSQMTSETRSFADPVSPYLNASFTFSYDYNLAGELKKITDPTNSAINYGFDSIGRLANITGSDNLYGGVSNYANGFSYRASGGIKGLTYGNNLTMSASYDSRLRPSRFQLTAPSGQVDVIKNDYTYYADGSPKYLQNLLDERFDRAYGYDHRGMMQQAFSGSEARDLVNNTTTPGATGPYWQIYQHDAFGNMTQRDNRFWTQSDVYTASYSNHRRTETGYQYDADGNLLQDPDVTFGYDAAGNNVFLSSPNGTAYTTTFDGDGQLVKKVHTFSGNVVFVKYSLRSSVLGGRIVTELSAQGQKLSTYVFAGGQLLARQQGGAVAWEHRDPLSGSQVDSFADGAFSPINQLDPMGLDVGFQDPFLLPCCDPPPPSDSGTLLPMWGDGIPSGRCTLDGIAIDCGWAFQMMNSGSAVQCPNNDCGPRVMNSYDRNGNFLGHVLSQAFQAFADGFSGFLPPGARYQGGGMWTISGSRPSERPSLKPGAPMPGAGAGNRNPFGGFGNDEGPGGGVSGSLGATPTFRFIGFPDPETPGQAREIERLNALVDANYTNCVRHLGNSPVPPQNSTRAILSTSFLEGTAATLLAVTWAAEAIPPFNFYPNSNPNDGSANNADIGPMQINYRTFHGWAPLANLGNVFGTTTTGREAFNGNPYDNLRAAARILNSYGGGRTAAGLYRTGTGDFSRKPEGRAAFAARAAQYDRWSGAYNAFFDCLKGR